MVSKLSKKKNPISQNIKIEEKNPKLPAVLQSIDQRYLVPEFDKALSTAAEEGQRKGRAPSNAVYWGPSFLQVQDNTVGFVEYAQIHLTCVP